MEVFVDGLLDAVVDCFKCLPILFLAYLLVAWLSHDHSHKFSHFLSKDKKTSVLYASLLGCVPQCGFSSVVADLYSRRSVSLGTLVAVFVATSDEALPMMISQPESIVSLLELIAIKVVLAIFWGYAIDCCVKIFTKKKKNLPATVVVEKSENAQNSGDLAVSCEGEGQSEGHLGHDEAHEHDGLHGHSHHHSCGHIHTDACGESCIHSHGSCCGNNIFAEAFDHTFEIVIYIFVASLVFNLILGFCNLQTLEGLFTNNVFVQILIASLIGLIPNCASSVFLVELFMESALAFPALVAGLTTGAGVGVVILFSRNKKHPIENISIVALQYLIGVVSGMILLAF